MAKQSFIKPLKCMFLLALMGLFTGCFQTKQTVWLNPDGSGKMDIDALIPVITLFEQETSLDALKSRMEKDVRTLISEASGVEAWSDVSYELTDEGKIHFKGTVYFPDISKVEIKNVMQGSMSFLPDGQGNLVLLLDEEGREREKGVAVKMTEEEIQEKIKTEKIKFNQARPMLSMFLSDFKVEALFYLPGEITKSSKLKNRSSGGYGLSIEGTKILEVLNTLASDDNWWRKQVKNSENILQEGAFGDELNEHLLGEKGPVKAVVSEPFAPLFDYAAEVAKASVQTENLKKSLGITLPAKPEIKEEKYTSAVNDIHSAPARGTIKGKEFRYEKAELRNNILTIRQGKDFFADLEIMIFFFPKEGESLENNTFQVKKDSRFGNPHVHMKWKEEGSNLPESKVFMSDYVMKVEFGQISGGRIPGAIYISLPDEEESIVSGSFEAEVK